VTARPALVCPRDGAAFVPERVQRIEVDRCPVCRGFWLDAHELGELEAARASEHARRGTVDYAQRASELRCPVCARPLTAFNYRAHNVELDMCEDEHGYWLDAGEEREVLAVLQERARGILRIPSAEAAWHRARKGGAGGGLFDRVRWFFDR